MILRKISLSSCNLLNSVSSSWRAAALLHKSRTTSSWRWRRRRLLRNRIKVINDSMFVKLIDNHCLLLLHIRQKEMSEKWILSWSFLCSRFFCIAHFFSLYVDILAWHSPLIWTVKVKFLFKRSIVWLYWWHVLELDCSTVHTILTIPQLYHVIVGVSDSTIISNHETFHGFHQTSLNITYIKKKERHFSDLSQLQQHALIWLIISSLDLRTIIKTTNDLYVAGIVLFWGLQIPWLYLTFSMTFLKISMNLGLAVTFKYFQNFLILG